VKNVDDLLICETIARQSGLGRLIEQENLGSSIHRAAAVASICCSPPTSCGQADCAVRPDRENRLRLIEKLPAPVSPLLVAIEAGAKVLQTVSR